MDKNRLGEETSPYLLQHRDNPVHWQPWGEATLAAAKAADKPILLSIGYAACHWCHVMAHESFEDPAIAARMNELFVNIKVDREERPDLDQVYQHALALMGEQGGWPLTMFLTPDGEPFWGGTYFPPEQRWGRPGFLPGAGGDQRGLRAASATTLPRTSPCCATRCSGWASRIRAASSPGISSTRSPNGCCARPTRSTAASAPHPNSRNAGIFELLWRAWKRTRQPPYRDAVLKALDAMCQGGIYDHLGGGFARYSTDARWLAPHFEKMLYDNAELVDLLTLVWQETRNPLYRERIEETLGWVAREMLTPGGGFASSLDADSEHEEGKFYVWSEAEIDAVLGERAALFKRFYDVTPQGNWEGHTILNRIASPALADEATERELAACRELLLQARTDAGAAGLGRQGVGRLERADDRGDGRGRHRFRAAGLDRHGARGFRLHSRGRWRRRMGGCCTAGARAGRATRPASTTTPISAAQRWRCTRRPATTTLIDQVEIGSRSSTAITATPRAAPISFRPTTRRR